MSSMIKLVSKDSHFFDVEEAVALESEALKFLLEDTPYSKEKGLQVINVSGNILAKVIHYCKEHVKANGSADEATKEALKQFDSEFVKVDKATLIDLIAAANYMAIKNLLDLTCQTAADMLKGKSTEEMRTLFNVQTDFSPQEEEQLRYENRWAFDYAD